MKYEKSVHCSNLESCKFYSPVYIDIQAGVQLLNPWQISIIENYSLTIMFITLYSGLALEKRWSIWMWRKLSKLPPIFSTFRRAPFFLKLGRGYWFGSGTLTLILGSLSGATMTTPLNHECVGHSYWLFQLHILQYMCYLGIPIKEWKVDKWSMVGRYAY